MKHYMLARRNRDTNTVEFHCLMCDHAVRIICESGVIVTLAHGDRCVAHEGSNLAEVGIKESTVVLD